MKPTVTLTILTAKFDEFSSQAKIAATFLPYIQIDVMDGKFVPTISFQERDKINNLNLSLKYELHLMVADPLSEIQTWQNVKNIFRALFHLESAPNLILPINFARKKGWEVGLAINPDTPLSVVKPFLNQIDVLQFMTVYPGKQGAPFEPTVLKKIREFTKLKKRPLCAVDGAVSPKTIGQLHDAGVEIFNVGSYFTKSANMSESFKNLQKYVK